ncbi:hypothetical protein BTH42_07080 [Burkholderia sp. SRS-W-2-2016]|uniref:hypothetical protein n=1 Tax=Burkholderia sp. SRS-W-2-2016 TaxID=1926878 RepID=UPI00094B4532|nr:hypothetical protein [Burkholderia sp. SRS-W-2-2016]OLL32209.1 hypothetical protein BTH42_07080 [Burkholderia sp. SRS-W-2-2016]
MTRPTEPADENRRFFSGIIRGALLSFGILMLAGAAAADMRSITIVSGTYGENCGAPHGNLTRDIARRCNGRQTCDYVVPGARKDHATRACPANFLAQWHCDGGSFHDAALSPGARSGDTLVLSCVESRGAGK